MPQPKPHIPSVHTLARPCTRYPIVFDGALGGLSWAANILGWTAGGLRKVCEKSIRTRHHLAFIEHPSDLSRDRSIYCLKLSMKRKFQVYFSIEQNHVLVRGFSWKIVGEPLDDFDGGVVIIS